MIVKLCSRVLNILTAILLLACSSSNIAPPSDFKIDSMEAYLSRASLERTNFEQFKVIDQDLVRECGEIRRGRHVTGEQDILTISEEDLNVLRQKVWALTTLPDLTNHNWAQSGRNRNLFDPGQLRLSLVHSSGGTNLSTSLDSISEPKGAPEQALLALVESLRSIGSKSHGLKAHCGYKEFFGIGIKAQ